MKLATTLEASRIYAVFGLLDRRPYWTDVASSRSNIRVLLISICHVWLTEIRNKDEENEMGGPRIIEDQDNMA